MQPPPRPAPDLVKAKGVRKRAPGSASRATSGFCGGVGGRVLGPGPHAHEERRGPARKFPLPGMGVKGSDLYPPSRRGLDGSLCNLMGTWDWE